MPSKQRNLRVRKPESEVEEEGSEEPEGISLQLEHTRKAQHSRKRLQGTNTAALAIHNDRPHHEEAEEPPDDAPSDLLEAYVKEQARPGSHQDPNQEKYIQEQLSKRLGKAGGIELGAEGDSHGDAFNELYHIPEELQGQASKQADVSAYMTGVVEVQLPMDYKIRNIEETEAAKKQMLSTVQRAGFRDAEESEVEGVAQAPPVMRGTYPRDFGRQRKGSTPSVQPESLLAFHSPRKPKEKRRRN